MKYKCILSDMDGVLIYSSPATRKAIIEVIKRRTGVITRPEDFTPFTGTGEGEAIEGICRKYGVPFSPDMKDEAYEIYRTVLFSEIGTFEKIPEALSLLKENGLKIIIASSADMIKVETNLKRAGITPDLYDGIVCGSQVQRRKPFPDVYLKAWELSALPKEQCVAVEDAVSGVKSAKAAEIDCIGITSVFSESTLIDAGCTMAFDGVYNMAKTLISNIY